MLTVFIKLLQKHQKASVNVRIHPQPSASLVLTPRSRIALHQCTRVPLRTHTMNQENVGLFPAWEGGVLSFQTSMRWESPCPSCPHPLYSHSLYLKTLSVTLHPRVCALHLLRETRAKSCSLPLLISLCCASTCLQNSTGLSYSLCCPWDHGKL